MKIPRFYHTKWRCWPHFKEPENIRLRISAKLQKGAKSTIGSRTAETPAKRSSTSAHIAVKPVQEQGRL